MTFYLDRLITRVGWFLFVCLFVVVVVVIVVVVVCVCVYVCVCGCLLFGWLFFKQISCVRYIVTG